MSNQIARSYDNNSEASLVTTSSPSTSSILSFKQEQEIQSYQDIIEVQQRQINQLTEQLTQLKNSSFSQKKSPNFWQKFQEFLGKIHGSSTYQPRFSLNQILFSYLGSFIGIAVLAYLSVGSGYPLIAAPFGAAAVLVFAVPNTPLAQPRNLILGNVLGAVVSVVMVALFGSEPWVMALAVATAIKLMQITKTLHPPGGAVALVGVLSKAQFSFIFTPVLAGSIILLFCTFIFNNLMPGRSYPKHWL
ncbi:MAG: HPP family protein [Xenococcaceae cyanobacterium MO_188.B19]|nr:HPP family protein [Xenococcaceae cyanobacterium MO_188.B19]